MERQEFTGARREADLRPLVASLCHSSRPETPSSAPKKMRPRKTASDFGSASHRPGQMSVTRQVPSGVPSVRQSSSPWAGSEALQ
jgi:hypothetical protein